MKTVYSPIIYSYNKLWRVMGMTAYGMTCDVRGKKVESAMSTAEDMGVGPALHALLHGMPGSCPLSVDVVRLVLGTGLDGLVHNAKRHEHLVKKSRPQRHAPAPLSWHVGREANPQHWDSVENSTASSVHPTSRQRVSASSSRGVCGPFLLRQMKHRCLWIAGEHVLSPFAS